MKCTLSVSERRADGRLVQLVDVCGGLMVTDDVWVVIDGLVTYNAIVVGDSLTRIATREVALPKV